MNDHDSGTDTGGPRPEPVADAALAREIRRRRTAAGLSQAELANLVGYSREYVSRAERPGKGLASGDLVRVIDAVLQADGSLVALHATLHGQRLARRHPPSVGSHAPVYGCADSAAAGEPRGSVVSMPERPTTPAALAPTASSPSPNPSSTATTGFSELIGHATSSAVGNDTVERYAEACVSSADAHTVASAREVLRETLALHCRVQGLLGGRLRLSQSRELYRIESQLLAHVCILLGDLGANDVAEQAGLAALTYAREADTCPAVAHSALAKTYRWQARYVESANIAAQGFVSAPGGPVKVALAHQEANAAALLGDIPRAHAALIRAAPINEHGDPGDPRETSVWSFPIPRQAVFAQSVATQANDPDAALRAAAIADGYWAGGGTRVLATWAQVRAGAGIAHLRKGSVDAAVAEVSPILDQMSPERRVSTVTAYVAGFVSELNRHPFTGSATVRSFSQRCSEFNAAALPKPPAKTVAT